LNEFFNALGCASIDTGVQNNNYSNGFYDVSFYRYGSRVDLVRIRIKTGKSYIYVDIICRKIKAIYTKNPQYGGFYFVTNQP
jgi:hypothetical protein